MTRLLLALVLLLATAGPVRADTVDVEVAIAEAAAQQGVSEGLLRCIAWHESSFRADARSIWDDEGLFQFHRHQNGWTLMAITPWADASPYDPEAAAQAAAWLIARGYGPHWATWWGCV